MMLQAEGAQALKEVIEAVPEGIPVILDVKRGDIDTTAEAYALAAKVSRSSPAAISYRRLPPTAAYTNSVVDQILSGRPITHLSV